MLLAVVLATVLGPLGLFYVSFINGVAALLVLPPVVRGLAGAIASSVGGSMDTVRNVAIPVLWCFHDSLVDRRHAMA
jgi:cation transporter-like permease